MNKFMKFLCLAMPVPCAFSTTACLGGTQIDDTAKVPVREWIETTTWNNDMRDAYLQPYWYTREVYNETGAILGEDGYINLMYNPTEIKSVRSYDLSTTYVEGVDYEVIGRTIKRIPTGNLPYRALEDYYHDTPNAYYIVFDDFDEEHLHMLNTDRYVHNFDYADSYNNITGKQIAVTYRHNDEYTGNAPASYEANLARFVTKVKNGEDVKILVYGDSVGTGCNASGTPAGGNVNPYMPDAWTIIKQYIENKYSVNVTLENMAVGGDTLKMNLDNFDTRYAARANDTFDLMLLRIGGNDQATSEAVYKSQLSELLDKFYAINPDSNVIVVSPERGNKQVGSWTGNVPLIESWEDEMLATYANGDKCALAKVSSFAEWTIRAGAKKTRDWLANDINHANDFMIRSYAQIVLKAMFGNDYLADFAK